MLRKTVVYIFTLFFLCPGLLNAQQLVPKGLFLSDSIKIGEEVIYSLSIEYPRGSNLIFPDSLYDFSPFEYIKKTEFFTKSDSVKSFDSVIYYLSTFEIDPVQKLTLPVFLISAGDSIGNHGQLMVSARVAAAAGLEPAPGDLVAPPVLLSPGQYAAIQLVPATLP